MKSVGHKDTDKIYTNKILYLLTRVDGDIDGYDTDATSKKCNKFETETVDFSIKMSKPIDPSYTGKQYWYMYGKIKHNQ